MRRWSIAPGVAVLLVFGAGCAGSAPVAQARGLARGPAPVVGACYDAPLAPLSMWADGTTPVPCTQTHRAETFHVGVVDAPAGAVVAQSDTRLMLELFDSCEVAATEFLGADWYSGRVEFEVTLPRPSDWLAGARGYSCEVAEIDQPGDPSAVRRTSSLRGALATPGPLLMSCFDMRSPPEWAPIVPARCDQPHDAEYAGVIHRLPHGNDRDPLDVALDACQPVVAAYVGALSAHIRWGVLTYGPPAWDAGQMAARCFVLPVEGTRFTATVKGIGHRKPPTG